MRGSDRDDVSEVFDFSESEYRHQPHGRRQHEVIRPVLSDGVLKRSLTAGVMLQEYLQIDMLAYIVGEVF